MEVTKGNGAPPGQPGGAPQIDCTQWDSLLSELFKKAKEASEDMLLVGAFIAHMPRVLAELGAHDLALGVKMRFFRETTQTQLMLPRPMPKALPQAPEKAPAPETIPNPPS